jgi:hypothetical protein
LFPLTFVPSIEPDNDFIVLADDPFVLAKHGKVMDVPFITGVNSMEALALITGKLSQIDHMKNFKIKA